MIDVDDKSGLDIRNGQKWRQKKLGRIKMQFSVKRPVARLKGEKETETELTHLE